MGGQQTPGDRGRGGWWSVGKRGGQKMRTLQGRAHSPTVPCPCRLRGLRQVLALNQGSNSQQQQRRRRTTAHGQPAPRAEASGARLPRHGARLLQVTDLGLQGSSGVRPGHCSLPYSDLARRDMTVAEFKLCETITYMCYPDSPD